MYIHIYGGIYMKRKLVKQGPQSLVVSLPSAWIKKNKLEKGNAVEIIEISNNLVISGKEVIEAKIREPYVLNIDNKPDYLVKRYLTMLYRLNYEEIVVTFSRKNVLKLKTKEKIPIKKFITGISSRFIGMEIISTEKNKIILKCFTRLNPEELKSIQRRIFLLMIEFMDNIFDKEYNRNQAHDNITKFINYFFRILNASPEASLKDKEFLYGFFSIQDKLTDFLRHVHFELNRAKKVSPKTKELIKDSFSLYKDLYHLFYKFKEDSKKEIVEKRYALIRKIHRMHLTSAESKIVYEVKFVLEIINDFYECLIGKELTFESH